MHNTAVHIRISNYFSWSVGYIVYMRKGLSYSFIVNNAKIDNIMIHNECNLLSKCVPQKEYKISTSYQRYSLSGQIYVLYV